MKRWLRSSLATVRRYRTATRHLENFAGNQPAHQVDVDQFVRYLRKIKVAPNGHSNTALRPLLDKGISYILETCRSLYGYAADHRHLPPYAEIPFKRLRSDSPALSRPWLEFSKIAYEVCDADRFSLEVELIFCVCA